MQDKITITKDYIKDLKEDIKSRKKNIKQWKKEMKKNKTNYFISIYDFFKDRIQLSYKIIKLIILLLIFLIVGWIWCNDIDRKLMVNFNNKQ